MTKPIGYLAFIESTNEARKFIGQADERFPVFTHVEEFEKGKPSPDLYIWIEVKHHWLKLWKYSLPRVVRCRLTDKDLCFTIQDIRRTELVATYQLIRVVGMDTLPDISS